MRAKSIKGNSPSAIQLALQQNMADGFKPTLAIVFISVKQDRGAICQILNNHNIDILGATSSGEFIEGHQSDGEIAMLLLDTKKEYYTILFRDTKNQDVATAAKDITDAALARFNNPAFIVCSSCIAENGWVYDGPGLVHSIYNAVGEYAPIFGAMSGDDGMLKSTFVFTSEHVTDEGFVMLVLDHNKIEVRGMAISGWKPLGRTRTVTKCEDGWMYTIDDQPALDMYLRYLGQSLKTGADGHKIVFVEDVGFYFPFLAIDAGEPLLRTPMEVSREKNAIRLDIAIPEGKQLQFTMPPDFDIVETVLENAAELKRTENAEAEALLVFSCLGRRSVLGPMVQEENEGLQKLWGAPMAGFYSYGEYGKDTDNNNLFHSTTCSWVTLKEK